MSDEAEHRARTWAWIEIRAQSLLEQVALLVATFEAGDERQRCWKRGMSMADDLFKRACDRYDDAVVENRKRLARGDVGDGGRR